MCIHEVQGSGKLNQLESTLRSQLRMPFNARMLRVLDGKKEAAVMCDFSSPEKTGQALADLQRWHPGCKIPSSTIAYIDEWGDFPRAEAYARDRAHSKNPPFDGDKMSPEELAVLFKNYGYI